MIDLRSDTLTRPTEAMLESMREATFGDDSRDGDATVQKLEALAAERTGKEAGAFMPSGTMTNLVAMLTHGGRGGEVLLEDGSHTLNAELGGIATVAGLFYRGIPGQARRDGPRHAARGDPADHAQPDGHRARLDGEHAQPLRRLGAAARLHGGGLEPRAREGRAGAPRRRAHLQRRDRAQGEARARSRSTPIRSASASPRACPRRSARYCAAARTSSSARAPTAAWSGGNMRQAGPRRRRRHRRARNDGGPPRRGSRQREAPRGGLASHRCEPRRSAGSRFQPRASGSEEERPPRRAVVGGPEAEGRGGGAVRHLLAALRHAPAHLARGRRRDGRRVREPVEDRAASA